MKLDVDLEIIDAICLTKPGDDGSKPWSKSWQVQVPQKFREHMLRPESISAKRVNNELVETVNAASDTSTMKNWQVFNILSCNNTGLDSVKVQWINDLITTFKISMFQVQ